MSVNPDELIPSDDFGQDDIVPDETSEQGNDDGVVTEEPFFGDDSTEEPESDESPAITLDDYEEMQKEVERLRKSNLEGTRKITELGQELSVYRRNPAQTQEPVVPEEDEEDDDTIVQLATGGKKYLKSQAMEAYKELVQEERMFNDTMEEVQTTVRDTIMEKYGNDMTEDVRTEMATILRTDPYFKQALDAVNLDEFKRIGDFGRAKDAAINYVGDMVEKVYFIAVGRNAKKMMQDTAATTKRETKSVVLQKRRAGSVSASASGTKMGRRGAPSDAVASLMAEFGKVKV